MDITLTFEQLSQICKYRSCQFSDGGVYPFCSKTEIREYCEYTNCPYVQDMYEE